MTVSVKISEQARRAIKVAAAGRGMTFSDYVDGLVSGGFPNSLPVRSVPEVVCPDCRRVVPAGYGAGRLHALGCARYSEGV